MNASPRALVDATLAGLRSRLTQSPPQDPCWLIGSTAALVSGVDDIVPGDVDLLMSANDAGRFIARHASEIDAGHRSTDDDRFRSRLVRFRFGPLPLEVMGGLEVRYGGRWRPVEIAEGLAVPGLPPVPGVPSLREQLRVLTWFGRTKDLEKAGRIRALMGDSEDSRVD